MMEKNILKFDSWTKTESNTLEEGTAYDRTVNWLSKNFGGKISKLDDILKDIKKIEKEYLDEWEDIISDIDSLEIEKEQAKSDPAERKKLDRIIVRKNSLLSALTKKHSTELKALKERGENIVEKTDRLKAYWDLELSNMESDLAEDMYKKAKELSTDVASDELYTKYRNAMEKAKKKDTIFRDKYGSLISFKFDSGSNSEFSFSKLLDMDLETFERSIKSMENSAIRKLIRYIKKERNNKYADLDKEKENLEKSLKSSPDKKREIGELIKDISAEHMDIIRDFRTKITIANRYV